MTEPIADGGKSNPSERLFIKVILPRQGAERKVLAGGAEPIPFRTVDMAFRKSLSTRIKAIDQIIRTSVDNASAMPVRVKLIGKASAKSHRPESLFSSSTCPIIGAGKLGELFIKATASGLRKIDDMVLRGDSDRIVKEISTVETIEPVTPSDRLGGQAASDVLRTSPKIGSAYLTKVQLFDFNDEDQGKLVDDFLAHCKTAKIDVQRRGYSEKSYYYEAFCKSAGDVEKLSKVVGVRSIRRMPVIKTIRSHVVNQQALPSSLPEPDGGISSYPTVAVVDSGISDKIPALNKWLVGRSSTVASSYRNTWHGTFVAGLICWAKEFNQDLHEIDASPCSIFDLQVLPNDDPASGEIDAITESQLLQDLEEALKQHANEIKVWNLSLGTDEVCSLDSFSSFAVELDRLQEKYSVSFVISAGNYSDRPLLDYPRQDSQLDIGRITTPADSVLSITVGAVAHKSHSSKGPRKGEPSAFSRHGAGPNHIIKPDLVHFGGTCSTDLSERFGIRSIDGAKVGESEGTSFSTPIVSRLLANIYHNITPTPSPVLARAILTHHSRDPRTSGRVPDKEENFLGFGMPLKLRDCLECTSSMSTLVFEDYLRPGYFLDWDNFPYPNCLQRNGRYYGDIWMTVAFAPATNQRWGTEYCETHVEAHFGVYHRQKTRNTGEEKIKFKGLVPPEHKNPGILYESYQVEKLRKWAPVRTYFGSLGESGVKGDRWRLKVQLLTRHGLNQPEVLKPQRFALIVTIADPRGEAPVYNDMAVGIRSRFQAESLTLRSTSRVQVKQ